MTSVFEWQGASSIFGTKATYQPLVEKPKRVAKEPYRRPRDPKPAYVPKTVWVTKPLADRIDFYAARDERLAGKTWKEMAKKFGTSEKAIRARVLEQFPELRTPVGINGGVPEKPFDQDRAIALIHAGKSITAIAAQLGMGKATLIYKLKRTPDGLAAHKLARERGLRLKESAILRDNAGNPFGSVHIPTRAETDRTNSIRGR